MKPILYPKRNRMLSAGLALLLLVLLPLSGCRKGEDISGTTETGEPIILEHVYSGTTCPLPEGWSLNPAVRPLRNAESGLLTCCASLTEENEDTDGNL